MKLSLSFPRYFCPLFCGLLLPLIGSAADLNLDQALPFTIWRAGNWEWQFEGDHVLRINEGAPPLRVWHWWVVGSHTVHVQFATDPTYFAKDKGADLTFDAALTKFSGGKNGEAIGFRTSVATTSAATPTPAVARSTPPPTPAPEKPKGIAIAGIEQEHHSSVLMAVGGHSLELQDVRTVLSRFGDPRVDMEAHPEISIFPGIRYLMPWHDAEKVLAPSYTNMKSGAKIACAGFPDGLSWVSYDGQWTWLGHRYNHLYIVKDITSQVVAIEFVKENDSWEQPPPWQTLPGNWHLMDYVNAEIKGQPQMRVVTQVLDQRGSDHGIVLHTSVFHRTGRTVFRMSATLFLPEPLINLMLYTTRP